MVLHSPLTVVERSEHSFDPFPDNNQLSYNIEAPGEEFVRTTAGDVYRRNEIWRTLVDRRTGNRLGEECVKRNCALVRYLPPQTLIRDL